MKDCATKLRVAYVLPVEVTEQWLQGLGLERIEVDRFSAYCVGAKDHARFLLSQWTHGAAVLGSHLLVITYGKLGSDAPPQDRDRLERYLRDELGELLTFPDLIQATEAMKLAE